MNFLSLPCTRDRWDLDLSTLRKTCIFISWTTRVHEIELFRITDCVKKKKKKEKTAPMIKISWQSRDITWLSRFDEKNCLSGFTVTSTRTLSKRENLDNCEPRGEGLASRLPARTRIIVVLWWAPDTSLLSLRESLPLDSSLSLSFHSLVSLHGFRAFHAKFRTARACEANDYDLWLRFDDRNHGLLAFTNFITGRKEILRETCSISLFSFRYSDHREISSLAIRCSEVPRGRPGNFTLISKRNVFLAWKRKDSLWCAPFPLERRKNFSLRFGINSNSS